MYKQLRTFKMYFQADIPMLGRGAHGQTIVKAYDENLALQSLYYVLKIEHITNIRQISIFVIPEPADLRFIGQNN